MVIHQSVTISTSPENIYGALLSAKEFSHLTGAPADIAAAEGGAFSCFGGQITGRHVELRPNQRIVQAWRAGPWPEGVYSIVRLDLCKSGAATTINLQHTGFPEDATEHLEGGWHKMYWEPMKTYFE